MHSEILVPVDTEAPSRNDETANAPTQRSAKMFTNRVPLRAALGEEYGVIFIGNITVAARSLATTPATSRTDGPVQSAPVEDFRPHIDHPSHEYDRHSPNRTPAQNYLELLELQHGGESMFDQEGIYQAASSFRSSLNLELARVIDVQRAGRGVILTAPFRSGSATYPLSVYLGPVDADAESGSATAGLRYYSRCYSKVPAGEALRWVREFNLPEQSEKKTEEWHQTTPWLSGSWCVLADSGPERVLMHKGFIPNALKEHTDLQAVVAGVIREVWMSCDKHRLHEQFKATVQGLDGTL